MKRFNFGKKEERHSEKGNNLVIKADLPGLDKKDINISLDNGVLTILADKKAEREIKKDNYYHLERSYGQFQRSIRLPEGLKEEQIRASYKDGVLTIGVAKNAEIVPKKARKIDIE